MGAAVALGNVVRIGRERFVVAVVPLHGDFHLDGRAVARDRFAGMEDLRVQDGAALVLEFHVGDETALRFEFGVVSRALVREIDGDAGIEERELAQTGKERVVVEFRDLLENLRVGKEVHFRSAAGGVTEQTHGRDDFGDARVGIHERFELTVLHLSAFKLQKTGFPVAAHGEAQPRRKRVHAGNADAVQAAGDLVAVVVELAARMQFRQGDFRGASLGIVLVVPFDGGGNAAPVVHDGDGVVGVDRHLNARGEARESFVDRVVDDFVDEMVQTGTVGRVADVHARALAYGLQTLQDLDAFFVVLRGGLRSGVRRAQRLFNVAHKFPSNCISFPCCAAL